MTLASGYSPLLSDDESAPLIIASDFALAFVMCTYVILDAFDYLTTIIPSVSYSSEYFWAISLHR